jgi:hypothetical protein
MQEEIAAVKELLKAAEKEAADLRAAAASGAQGGAQADALRQALDASQRDLGDIRAEYARV